MLESRKDEDGSLAHAGLGLGQDVHAQHSLQYEVENLNLGKIRINSSSDFCENQSCSNFPPPCYTGEPRAPQATGQESATYAPISIPLRVSSSILTFCHREPIATRIGIKGLYLRDTLVLDLRGMLKAAIHDGTKHLGLQQEVTETRGVDGDVVALDLALLLGGAVLGSSLSCGGLGLRIVLVVQELLVHVNIVVCHLESVDVRELI